MASIGHPVIGDPLYGRKPKASRAKAAVGDAAWAVLSNQKTQLLHAYLIGFTHPETGEIHRYISKNMNNINDILNFLN